MSLKEKRGMESFNLPNQSKKNNLTVAALHLCMQLLFDNLPQAMFAVYSINTDVHLPNLL